MKDLSVSSPFSLYDCLSNKYNLLNNCFRKSVPRLQTGCCFVLKQVTCTWYNFPYSVILFLFMCVEAKRAHPVVHPQNGAELDKLLSLELSPGWPHGVHHLQPPRLCVSRSRNRKVRWDLHLGHHIGGVDNLVIVCYLLLPLSTFYICLTAFLLFFSSDIRCSCSP